jgi:hypothetical protein
MVLQICYEEVGIGDITIAIDKNADLEKRIAIAPPKLKIERKPISLERMAISRLNSVYLQTFFGSRCCR